MSELDISSGTPEAIFRRNILMEVCRKFWRKREGYKYQTDKERFFMEVLDKCLGLGIEDYRKVFDELYEVGYIEGTLITEKGLRAIDDLIKSRPTLGMEEREYFDYGDVRTRKYLVYVRASGECPFGLDPEECETCYRDDTGLPLVLVHERFWRTVLHGTVCLIQRDPTWVEYWPKEALVNFAKEVLKNG